MKLARKSQMWTIFEEAGFGPAATVPGKLGFLDGCRSNVL